MLNGRTNGFMDEWIWHMVGLMDECLDTWQMNGLIKSSYSMDEWIDTWMWMNKKVDILKVWLTCKSFK